jgi:hypothetical protein
VQTVDGVSQHAVCDMLSTFEHRRLSTPEHPLAVLSYATRHNYPEISDMAAKETIGNSADEVAAVLSSTYLIAWVSE